MRITPEMLKEYGACPEGIEWLLEKKSDDPKALFELAVKEDKLDWANWTICRIFDRKQKIKYAVFAAEQVLHVYEKEHPEDDRPRKAIKVAKKVLEDDTSENRNSTHAAAHAAYTAANAAYAFTPTAYTAADAAYAAADAAYTAFYATFDTVCNYATCDSATSANSHAAHAAADAACDSAASFLTDTEKTKTMIKILEYGMKLLNLNEAKKHSRVLTNCCINWKQRRYCILELQSGWSHWVCRRGMGCKK